LIGGATTTATVAGAGCSELDSRRANDPPDQRETAAGGHDHAGDYLGESDPVERIDVGRLNGSRRVGDTVYYHPDERGPYADGQAAFDDVPPGGTFVLGHGAYDVASEGRLVRSTAINIRGQGWRRDNAKDTPVYRGSVFVNTGGDVVDEPVIDCTASDGTALQNTIRDVGVIHEGPSSPALRIRNFVFNTIADCGVECTGTGAKGVSFEEGGYFTRMHRCQVSQATDVCVHISGVGYAHELYSNHIRTHQASARAALQTERQRTIVVGGEYGVRNEEGPPAIRYYNPGTDGIQYGGLVVEPGFEHDSRIEIDGRAPFNDVQIVHTKLPTGHDPDRPTVIFGNTDNSKLLFPVVKRSGYLAHWSEQARNCGIVADARTLTHQELTDDGATNPYVSVRGSATPDQLADIQTTVPTYVEYGTEPGAPVLSDGDGWYSLASARQAYDPGA
jgi:hypothetical protein